MHTIFEQGDGRGHGRSREEFLRRFDDICAEHSKHNRAKAFALILYDFRDKDLRRILKDHGVFIQLDRRSGSALSIFYLHTGSADAIRSFNDFFLIKLGITDKATTPCMIFFKLGKDGFYDITVAQLDSANLIHGFHELYQTLDAYINESIEKNRPQSKAVRLIKGAGQLLAVEVLRAALREALQRALL